MSVPIFKSMLPRETSKETSKAPEAHWYDFAKKSPFAPEVVAAGDSPKSNFVRGCDKATPLKNLENGAVAPGAGIRIPRIFCS